MIMPRNIQKQSGCLVHLLERSWFTHTWVIQEVALATHAEIVCGDATLGWDTLERVID
jgi:hypothetical protein